MGKYNYQHRVDLTLDDLAIELMLSSGRMAKDDVIGFRFTSLDSLYLRQSESLYFDDPGLLSLTSIPFHLTSFSRLKAAELESRAAASRRASIDKILPLSSNAPLAILDSGISQKSKHAILAKSIFQKCFSSSGNVDDTDGHGTEVATAIAGFRFNGTESDGLLKNAELLIAKTHDDRYQAPSISAFEASLCWALESGAIVINISASVPRRLNEKDGYGSRIDLIMRNYPGRILVASIGDSNENGAFGIGSPACARSAIAVAAWDFQYNTHYEQHPKSDKIKLVTLSAIGDGLVAFNPTTLQPSWLMGTSGATAFVSARLASMACPNVDELELVHPTPMNFRPDQGGRGIVKL